jgi:hypothetical protein
VTPRELLRLVRVRAWEVFLANKGEITFEASQRLAAKQIVAEHKARPRRPTAQHAATANSDITVKNARQVLLAQLRALAERLRNPLAPSAPPVASERLVATTKRPVNITQQPEQQPEPTPTPPAASPVFIGNNGSAVLIPDSEFEPRWRAQSLATENWRKSIATNEIISRRNGRWVG